VSGDARPRARGARGTTWELATASLVAAGLLCALAAARASAQGSAADSAAIEGAAEADTGWVEIGGSTPFGEDDPFADLPLTSESETDEPGARFFPYVDYNRVDALTLGLDHSFKPKQGWLPGISFRFARAFGRLTDGGADHGEWLYDLRLEQPLLPGRAATLEVAQFRATRDDGFDQIGGFENTLNAVFFKYDWKDWFATEGWEATLRGRWRERWSAGAGYTARDDEVVLSPGYGANGLFRRGFDWRENPPADAGDLRLARFFAGYDSRSTGPKPRRGMWHRLEAETAGGSLGGDFAYIRYLGDLRAYLRPAPSHYFKARVMGGTTSEGDFLPFQRTFAVGGVGTLRATPFREHRGRHLFLVNADWAWELLRRSSKNAALKTGLAVVLWNDLGLAWDAPSWDLGHRRPAWNLGVGIGTTEETLRVYFGRDVREEHAPIHVTVRVAQSY
jgi:hypothetical protein